MTRMPATVVLTVALSVLLGLEALAVLGFFAATASGRGVESAGVFIGGVLLMIHAGQFVAGAVHRRAAARISAIRKALPLATIAAIALSVAARTSEEELPRTFVAGVAVGFVAPLAAVGLLLLGRAARTWFDRPGEAA